MKYLKYLQTTNDFESFKNSESYILPNVSYVVETKGVSYEPYVPPFEIEIPSPYTEWARIQHKNGTLYTVEEWLAAKTAGTVTNADANGVAVLYSKYAVCPHVIHPKNSTDYLIWSNTSVKVSGVTTTTGGYSAARLDVNGRANTEAILAAVTAGTIADAPAAQYCAGVTFANDHQGYLPAAGEVKAWQDNKTAVNACMDAIGGDKVAEKGFWSSTQTTDTIAWIWDYYNKELKNTSKTYNYTARPATAFNYSPKNEFSNK